MKPIFSETGITKLPSIRISDSFGIRNGFSYDDLSAVLKLEPMSPQKLQGYNQDSLDPITPKNGENLFFSN